jgi:hypothetical protein
MPGMTETLATHGEVTSFEQERIEVTEITAMQRLSHHLSPFSFHFLRPARPLIAAAHTRVVLLTLITSAAVQHGDATGFYGPQSYLDNGGRNLGQSPEFYWDLEVTRLAKNFKPTEKRVPLRYAEEDSANQGEQTNKEIRDEIGAKMTADADTLDFSMALKEGRIKPPDLAGATAQHTAARNYIANANDKSPGALPEEFASEFSDYHRGAFAYRQLKWTEAKVAWETLLNRPAEERHYRSVWAAFMLGKIALKQTDFATAVKWFQAARDFAKNGFADSLGLAADSYGWEGRSELKQGHPERAAKLFLAQLALGDKSAIVSLKALVPDRPAIDGFVNYGPASEEDSSHWTDERQKAEAAKTLEALKAAAKDPLLRQLVTVHILATESDPTLVEEETYENPEDLARRVNRCARWLSVIKDARIEHVENADYLGWVAYVNGDYQGAERWLKLSDQNTPAALWLSAKLLRRAGKLDEAVVAMQRAQQTITTADAYTGWALSEDPAEYRDFRFAFGNDLEGEHWPFEKSASGDLGALLLEQTQFTPALATLLNGAENQSDEGNALWDDAAFIAERVLKTDELKTFVDCRPVPTGTPESGGDFPTMRLRYLLGRRFVREDRYTEAGSYLKSPYDKVLAVYVSALESGANEKLSKLERAKAWFKAAWLARYDGMEIMGTEGAPDGFSTGGDFEMPDLAKQQESGVYEVTKYNDPSGEEKKTKVPIILKPSKDELTRLSESKTSPDLRFHYRVIAGALAIKAAALLGDNTEELADVLNTAGAWVKDRDAKLGDRYYQILKNRASKTKIGRQAVAKHWFVSESGPWSAEQQAAFDKLHKDLGLGSE